MHFFFLLPLLRGVKLSLLKKKGVEGVKFSLLKRKKEKRKNNISDQFNTAGFAFVVGMTAVSTQTL